MVGGRPLWTRSPMVLVAAALVAITVTPAARTTPSGRASSALPPGCAADRSAVAFHSDSGDDWIYADIGPDGTPWTSFYSDCLKDESGHYTDASCTQDQGQWIGGGGSHTSTRENCRPPGVPLRRLVQRRSPEASA
jgi:hypothetical protein